MSDETEAPGYLTPDTGYWPAYECTDCGSLVVNRDRHTRFHADLVEDHRLAAGGQYRIQVRVRDREVPE